VYAVAADDSGNLRLTGNFSNSADFGGGARSGSIDNNLFVLALAADGTHQWDRTWAMGSMEGRAIAVDAVGNVFIAGLVQGIVDLGGGTRIVRGAVRGVFVLSLDRMGNYRWDHVFDADAQRSTLGVTTDDAGNVYVTGDFARATDFGGGPRISAGRQDIFVLSLDSRGAFRWDHTYGAELIDTGASIAVSASGTVFVTGRFQNAVDFGSGLRTSATPSFNIFVLALDSDGTHLWDRTVGGTHHDEGTAVAADTSGGALVTGRFNDTVDFGGGPRTVLGMWQAFILALGPDGTYRWDRHFEGGSRSWGRTIAVGPAGNVYAAGSIDGPYDLGGGERASAGNDDIFVLGLDADGSHLWDRVFGSPANDEGLAIAVTGGTDMVVTGQLAGTLDFGGGPHTPSGFTDGFLLSISP